MRREEAKRHLLLYRPGGAEPLEPETSAALACLEQDPELREWFDEHCAFQQAVRAKFQEISAPPELRDRILADVKVVRPGPWWQRTEWLIAAAIVFLLGLGTLFLRPGVPDHFSDFRSRMVRKALREYQMDILTNDMTAVRAFMKNRGAPSDYQVPKELKPLALTGAGFLRWRNNPVAMVCFDRGNNQMLFLFVLDRAAVRDAPPAEPQITKVNKLATASWTDGDRTYLLAGPPDAPGLGQPASTTKP